MSRTLRTSRTAGAQSTVARGNDGRKESKEKNGETFEWIFFSRFFFVQFSPPLVVSAGLDLATFSHLDKCQLSFVLYHVDGMECHWSLDTMSRHSKSMSIISFPFCRTVFSVAYEWKNGEAS